ncbi:MAG: hypothetical protein LKF38_06975 [Bifidobacterium sp.]|jgi:hypothetical protein|nr:hypothetical protein [Bifidobacterium sp.]
MWPLFHPYDFPFRTGGGHLMQAVMVLLLGLLCLLAGAITNIMMMCLPSQPAGARFDRVPAAAYPTGYAPQPVYQQDIQAPRPGIQYQAQPPCAHPWRHARYRCAATAVNHTGAPQRINVLASRCKPPSTWSYVSFTLSFRIGKFPEDSQVRQKCRR